MTVSSAAARTFGQRVRRERLRRELTLEDLGALAEIHWTNIGRIERGQANPSLVTIVRLAVALDLDPSELVNGLGGEHLPTRSHRLTARDFLRERAAREAGRSGE